MGESLTIDKLLSLRDDNNHAPIVSDDDVLLSSPLLKVPRPPLSSLGSSQSSSVSPGTKFTSKLKKFKGKPSIIDEPQLVELCEHYITTKNVTGLSLIARQRGLPPHLRHRIWPLLLKTHPFLIKPYITPDEDEEEDELEIKKKIKHDLKKYFKRSHNHIDVNDKQTKKEQSAEVQELLKIEDEIIKVMQYSITKFLKKWGSLINYNSGLTWIALGLAEWVPPLSSNEVNSNYVLCGREHVNRNGETCLKNINDELNEYLNYSNYVSEELSFNVKNGSPSSMSTIFPSFSSKKQGGGDTISDASSAISDSTFTTTNSATQQQPQQTKPSVSSSINGGGVSKNLSFAEVYERMVLVILHSPEPSEDSSSSHSSNDLDEEEETLKEKILTTLPVKGGTAEERLSFFLYCLRRLLPELAQFFTDEDILNTTTVKDDWVVWWLKWCGAKVWSKYDRGRIWDMLLGWRNHDDEFISNEELNDLILDDGITNLLGPDIYWHPLTFDNEESIDDDNNINNNSNPGHDRRGSLKHLISSLSVSNLSDDQNQLDNENAMLKEKIPFSNLDPHTEIVFISLSFIKSKEFALLELEQSEIREFLNRASSTKLDGFQNLFEDEINSNDNNNNNNNNNNENGVNANTNSVVGNNNNNNNNNDNKNDNNEIVEDSNEIRQLEDNNNVHKKTQKNGLRDIENIIMESGELWRKWIWQEVVD